MHIVCAQTKAKRHVNQEDYCDMDLWNHLSITAKYWQVPAQDSQNIQHSYSLSLPMMKQSWGCFWPPLFWDFLSFLSQLMAKSCIQTIWLQRNSNMLSAFGAGTPVWGWRRRGTWFRSTKCKYCRHCTELKVHTSILCLQNWREVFCMLKFTVVEGLFHQFTQVPSPKQYGARVKEN